LTPIADAKRERDGVNFDGRRVSVEFAKGAGPRERVERAPRERPARGPAIETGFQVEVSGIPPGTSWQVRAIKRWQHNVDFQ